MKRINRQTIKKIRYKLYIIWPLLALVLLGAAFGLERMGVRYKNASQQMEESEEPLMKQSPVYQQADTLLLTDFTDAVAQELAEEMAYVLKDMKVSYEIKDVESFVIGEIKYYDKVIIGFSDLDLFGNDMNILNEWVMSGGKLMNLVTYNKCKNFMLLAEDMGIQNVGAGHAKVDNLRAREGFMIGSDRTYYFDDAYAFSLYASLSKQAKVHLSTEDNKVPLLWEKDYGEGKYIVFNMGLSGKLARGFWSAGYSLMEDVFAYPVINASAFYLDDFPSPVPTGNGDYIYQDYGLDIGNFYSNIWWNDVLSWEKKYGIIHTGLIIEDYSDVVKAPFERQTSVEQFRFFGNMLMNNSGELGFHGYNHMPLCLKGFDYKGLYDEYEQWNSTEDMAQALKELYGFSKELFPNNSFKVYVPPSNILSQEGRATLIETLPEIRAIAATYLPGDCVYEQEFTVSDDDIVETPRITSGFIMDDYTYLIAFSELNYHYVQSHFMHPDDVLDEERGAALGWEQLSQNFGEYLEFVYQAAPNIKAVTGSGMAKAVREYHEISVRREQTADGIRLTLGNFTGQAALMLRLNQKNAEIESVTGADFEQLTKELYLIHATDNTVEIKLGEKQK